MALVGLVLGGLLPLTGYLSHFLRVLGIDLSLMYTVLPILSLLPAFNLLYALVRPLSSF